MSTCFLLALCCQIDEDEFFETCVRAKERGGVSKELLELTLSSLDYESFQRLMHDFQRRQKEADEAAEVTSADENVLLKEIDEAKIMAANADPDGDE